MFALGGTSWLPTDTYTELICTLSSLLTAEFDAAEIRASALPAALRNMTATGSRWPFAVRGKARLLLKTWDVKQGLGGQRGAAGRASPRKGKARSQLGSFGQDTKLQELLGTPTEVPAPAWGRNGARRIVRSKSLQFGDEIARRQRIEPLTTGHLGLKVGECVCLVCPGIVLVVNKFLCSCWARASAAKEAGIIETLSGITADDEGAYAIVMVGDQEQMTNAIWRTKYKAASTDPLKTRLARNLRTQDPIRVLRSWSQESRLGPKAGVRYDGL